MPSTAIIIPCYNECQRMNTSEFISFSHAYPDVQFYFVNDGSTDDTKELLQQIQCSSNSITICLEKNFGKAEAIRQGFLKALENNHDLIGYLDADLSTGLEEFYILKQWLVNQSFDYVLGSRIKKADTDIRRSFFRHVVGRMIATLIELKFSLGIYDTQCGAKIFRSAVLQKIVSEHFYTRWFFDVEILLRIKKAGKQYKVAEVPLSKWHNVAGSKLSLFSFPSIAKDLWLLLSKY